MCVKNKRIASEIETRATESLQADEKHKNLQVSRRLWNYRAELVCSFSLC